MDLISVLNTFSLLNAAHWQPTDTHRTPHLSLSWRENSGKTARYGAQMGAALVSTGGSWHQNMPWKRLDKNNRILLAVFKEVCWRLIKDSDLCGLHRKKQILCFLNNGAFQRGCNVQHFQQRAQGKDGGGLIRNRKWKTSLAPLTGNQFFSSWTLVLFYFSFGVGGWGDVVPHL